MLKDKSLAGVWIVCLSMFLLAVAGCNSCETFKSGSPQQVQARIQAGANVNAGDTNGMTPLMWAACYNPNPEVITSLIKAGADVNAEIRKEGGASSIIVGPLMMTLTTSTAKGFTPLMWAAGYNTNPEVITALIDAGADVNAKSAKGLTPLIAAACNRNPKFVAVLLNAGADVNAKDTDGGTPLMWAAYWNTNPEVVAALIKAGADIHAKDVLGESALDYARAKNNPRAVTVMIKAGAK